MAGILRQWHISRIMKSRYPSEYLSSVNNFMWYEIDIVKHYLKEKFLTQIHL